MAWVRKHPRAAGVVLLAASWATISILTAGFAAGISIGFDDESETTYTLTLGGLAADGQPLSATDLALAAAASTGPEAPDEIPFQSPLQDWTGVTDRFGAPRPNDRTHSGLDLALATFPGSGIHAACAGRVSVATDDPGYGLYVVVACGQGWSVLSAHLSEILVEEGQVVKLGQRLGISGSTGFSTGEHLHFEVRKNGIAYNPELYIDFGVPPDAPLSTDPLEPLEPSPEEDVVEEPLAEETATAEETPTPEPTATCTPPDETPAPDSDTGPVTPTPSPKPRQDGTIGPTPTPTPSPTATATASPSPSPEPAGWAATPTATPTPVCD